MCLWLLYFPIRDDRLVLANSSPFAAIQLFLALVSSPIPPPKLASLPEMDKLTSRLSLNSKDSLHLHLLARYAHPPSQLSVRDSVIFAEA